MIFASTQHTACTSKERKKERKKRKRRIILCVEELTALLLVIINSKYLFQSRASSDVTMSIITKSLRTIKTAYQRRSHVVNGMNGWQRSDAQNVARSLLLTERKNRQKKKKRRKKHGLLTGTA
jgi:hypothetical protein